MSTPDPSKVRIPETCPRCGAPVMVCRLLGCFDWRARIRRTMDEARDPCPGCGQVEDHNAGCFV